MTSQQAVDEAHITAQPEGEYDKQRQAQYFVERAAMVEIMLLYEMERRELAQGSQGDGKSQMHHPTSL